MHRFFPTLVRLSGHGKILEIPVKHRPRERGKTKYGINNRLWVGIIDTFAVLWMRIRLVFPKSVEDAE
jgi:dolichol-phosphate mannosyltransferase